MAYPDVYSAGQAFNEKFSEKTLWVALGTVGINEFTRIKVPRAKVLRIETQDSGKLLGKFTGAA